MALMSKLGRMKILLIDGDVWIRDSLSLFFEGEWCDFFALETAEEALEVLQSQRFDVVISDYRLPDMNGLEFFKRAEESHSHAMRILITWQGDMNIVSEATEMGIDTFIQKPFTTEVIEESLRLLIEKHMNEDPSLSAKDEGQHSVTTV